MYGDCFLGKRGLKKNGQKIDGKKGGTVKRQKSLRRRPLWGEQTAPFNDSRLDLKKKIRKKAPEGGKGPRGSGNQIDIGTYIRS